ncbi:hypothetical protein DOY81_006050 [Sarcophaga bullata]|nr:hypothetical protein DOY81_006050 [Sarcophaga bullata]
MFSPTTLQMTIRPSTLTTFTKYCLNKIFVFCCNYKNSNIINKSCINSNNINTKKSNKLSKIIKSLWWLFFQHHRHSLYSPQLQKQQSITNTYVP